MLARVYGLKDEVSIFFESQGKQDLLLPFQSQEFQLAMAYLVDIFEALNCLNLLLQGKNTNRIKDYDEIRTFIAKLGLWHRRVQRGNAASFPTLDIALENSKAKLEGELKVEVESHLQILKEEYDCYFPDLGNVELTEWKMTRNPFRIKEDILSEKLQEEFLEMKCNSIAKMILKQCLLTISGLNICIYIRMWAMWRYVPFFHFHRHIYVKVDFQHL